MSQSWYFSAVPEEDCGDTGCHSAAHGGSHTEAGKCILDTAAVHGEPMVRRVFWQDWWPKRGRMLEQLAPAGLHPVEGTHSIGIHEEQQPTEQSNIGAVCEGLPPACGTLCWRRRAWGATDTMHHEWTTNPFSHPLAALKRWKSGLAGMWF